MVILTGYTVSLKGLLSALKHNSRVRIQSGFEVLTRLDERLA